MEGSVVAASSDIENQYDSLQTLINNELVTLSSPSLSRCIYRVPNRLRRVREEAYTPSIISIGPFHHGKETLKAMEDHKRWYLKCFMCRTNSNLKDCIRKIKDQEEKLRSCYAETIKLESDDFVKMILLDGIFIIEFLHRYPFGLKDRDDCIFGKPRMVEDIVPDLLMLENQLPFFILEDLFGPGTDSVRKSYTQFLLDRCGITFGIEMDDYSSNTSEVHHFVDLLRKLLIDPVLKGQSMMKKTKTSSTAPSIEKLHLSGVKFMVESTTNLFDIQFDEGILKIPRLLTEDSTELVLRNLIAFEQCSTLDQYCITDYISLMDDLVNTPKDVELLVKYKIIENNLGGGDHELSGLINSLSTGLMFERSRNYYGDLSTKLDEFHSSVIWHKWMASLRRNYFNSPWATISILAAVVLLILTAIQTIYAIIPSKCVCLHYRVHDYECVCE